MSLTLASLVNTLGADLLRRYGERVHKLAIDAGFTYPNRDETPGAALLDDGAGQRAGSQQP